LAFFQTKEYQMKKNMQMNTSKQGNPYIKLMVMAVLSFISMYVLMYAMVNAFENVIPNINQFYMAGLMTAPMIIIELILMGSMYMNKKVNYIIIAISSILLIAFFLLIRQQTAVSDKQFLKSMIPHHASAILMCEKTNLQDPEIKDLCKSIISGQQEEIDQMKAKLKELEK
jgi:uncharacterized protein (DUF305 family)